MPLFGDVVGFWPDLHARLFAIAKRAGAINRVLFGTTGPLAALWLNPEGCDPTWANLHRIVDAVLDVNVPPYLQEQGLPVIDDDELIGILHGNAEALFESTPRNLPGLGGHPDLEQRRKHVLGARQSPHRQSRSSRALPAFPSRIPGSPRSSREG